MDRLEFLKKSVYAAAGIVVGTAAVSGLSQLTGCSTTPEKKIIGLQLYSLRDMASSDIASTLEKVAAMGYKTLELASYNGETGQVYGMDPLEFKALVEKHGMKILSAHLACAFEMGKEETALAWWAKAIDVHKALDCKYLVQPSYPGAETLEELKAACDYFEQIAVMAKAKGMRFGYHNHAGEFEKIEEEIIYDYMLANTKEVIFQMDVYWVGKGGYDPVDYLKKYKGRFPVLHINDESIIGDSGTIDFKPIFEAAYAGGMEDYFVEVERYTMPAENCVARSFDFLEVASYVK